MLGQELVKVFDDKNYELTAWDKEDFDITAEKKTVQKIRELKPEIIINAVAYNAVDKCEESEAEFTLAKKINGEIIKDLKNKDLSDKEVSNMTLLKLIRPDEEINKYDKFTIDEIINQD